MTPQLTAMLNNIIAGEETLALMEQYEMNQAHVESLHGFKRFHRYRSMDRQRHSIMLQNFIAENYHTEPMISMSFATPSSGMSLADGLKAMHDKGIVHLSLLKSACNASFSEDEHLLAGYLEMMIKDQMDEISDYYRIWMAVKREDADLNYISDKLHKKYKCKEAKKHCFKV